MGVVGDAGRRRRGGPGGRRGLTHRVRNRGVRAWRLAAAFALATVSVAASPAARAEPASVELRVVTYNTHGLPSWIAGDEPERRFPEIARRLQGYDVALLQEDFAYHEPLRAGLPGFVLERGNESRFRGSLFCALACDGSGLTFATRLPRSALVELDSVAYLACSGWVGGANDCLATKGFQHARLLLPGGLELHLVNTHLDAGRAPADRAARRTQLERLRRRLERTAAGAALVLGGDLNLDAADPRDAALRDEFARALGLADTGAAPAPGGPWRRLDYLYRRDGAAVLVQVLEAGEAREFSDGARPLSDHPALSVRLRVRPVF
jgi:endonuclease/exonuclease/phosphatase family metal-dependent hydrolase